VDALARIKELVRKGSIRFTLHARQRMDDRNATARDVKEAVLSATNSEHDVAKDNYRVTGGCDADGDPMTVVAAIEADVVIVTIF
jgi:hypothetical protein